MMLDMAETAARLDAFLDSYKGDDWRLSLFGPVVYPSRPPWWRRSARRADDEMQRRLTEHGLPQMTAAMRWRWFAQPGQMMEDAGGYLRRRWMVAFGFDHSEYDAWRYPPLSTKDTGQ